MERDVATELSYEYWRWRCYQAASFPFTMS